MELTVLVDNKRTADNCLISEHGLSFLVEGEKAKILFDCGASDAFIQNAADLKIDLSKITDIILSHGHSDHIGGFLRLQALYEEFEKKGITFDAKRVLAHPDVFKPKGVDFYHGENLNLSTDQVQKFFNLALSIAPKYISSKFVYLGEIPLRYEIPKQDVSTEETCLVYKSKDGLVILSGCSHCGVRNIVEYAKYAACEQRVNTIIGGLYLINRSEEEVHALGKYLHSQGIKIIYPCHCTDVEAKAILSKYVGIEDVCTGKSYTWE